MSQLAEFKINFHKCNLESNLVARIFKSLDPGIVTKLSINLSENRTINDDNIDYVIFNKYDIRSCKIFVY